MLVSRLLYYISSIPTLLIGLRNWPLVLAIFAHLPIRKPAMVELRREGTRFKVRTSMDVWVIKEACLDRDYEKASVPVQNGWTVIDIGAGLGDFAIQVAQRHPQSVVHAYEPFRESFALLQENVALNNLVNVQMFSEAVSGSDQPLTLYTGAAEAVQHSTAVMSGELTKANEVVASTTLDHIVGNLGTRVCDFLKIDCEGAEYDILFGTSDHTLSQIKHVCLEYHDSVTSYNHADLVRFFQAKGFEVRLRPNPAHRHIGFVYARNPAL